MQQFLQRPRGLVIAGTERRLPQGSGSRCRTRPPANYLATVASGGAADVDAAVQAAREALGPWSAEAPARRAGLLWELGG